MEGIDMKNIIERAREYADRHKAEEIVGKVYGYERIYNAEIAAYERGAKDQKAIEEEITLKKSDDMTKAEYDREMAFADWYLKNGKSTPTFSDAIEWARKDVISKACDWLKRELQDLAMDEVKDNFLENDFKVILKSQVPDWLIDFRKAMEE